MLSVRRANLSDAEDIYRWEFHPSSRKWMSDITVVDFRNHMSWLRDKLVDETVCLMIICKDNTKKIAIVRCNISDCSNKVEIGITVDPDNRGKGYSRQCLRLAMIFTQENIWPIFTFTSKIKHGNTVSQKLFTSMGFKFVKARAGFDYFECNYKWYFNRQILLYCNGYSNKLLCQLSSILW